MSTHIIWNPTPARPRETSARQSTRGHEDRSIHLTDVISISSGMIGIFVFLTGINSVPAWLVGAGQAGRPLFTPTVSTSVSVPLFVLGVLFFWVMYLVVLIKTYQLLWKVGLIRVWGFSCSPEAITYTIKGRGIFEFVFVVGGIALGVTFFQAFWGPLDAVFTLVFSSGAIIERPILAGLFVLSLLPISAIIDYIAGERVEDDIIEAKKCDVGFIE